jgi:hypothetical protein
VEHPARLGEAAALHHLLHHGHTQALAAVLGKHVDVRQVGMHGAVGDCATESHLAAVVEQADHPKRRREQQLHRLARPAQRPVGMVGQVVVDGIHIHPFAIVVELVAGLDLASHTGQASNHQGDGGSELGRRWLQRESAMQTERRGGSGPSTNRASGLGVATSG